MFHDRTTISKRNATGVRGVSFEAKRWQARIYANGKHKHIGYFAELADAAIAYERAVRELQLRGQDYEATQASASSVRREAPLQSIVGSAK